MTTCQKAAEMPQQTEIQASVELRSYRYYKLDVDEIGLDEFTIQLNMLEGQSEIFHSFNDQYPKSPEDFIDPATIVPDKEGNFVERGARLEGDDHKRSDEAPMEKAKKKKKTAYYQIQVPNSSPNDVLYFSVRGLSERNEIQIYVHNRTVNFAHKLVAPSASITGLILVFGILKNFFIY